MENKTNILDLQNSIELMIIGERKRREKALNFINQFANLLSPIGEDIWGNGEYDYTDGVVQLTKIKDNKKVNTCFYFRYIVDGEQIGFYDMESQPGPIRCKPISKLRGKDFWYAIQIIIDWITIVNEAIEKRNQSRDQLLEKIEKINL